ncbi:hypothetical protein IFM89_003413 [Coptis chinensis]|uniref:Uncharacterized protein n=1 Tax=Coptis chinensis TaxID=261450 RepID=A0A835GUB2_9MAGN|nr:hypothetical protein IFM89_003413 [Coptis chinensis]
MGRAPCCEKNGLKKGPWTPEEDQKLLDYIKKHGHGSWRTLPKNADLQRCGKSCRLRWTNYLRPDIKRGRFSFEEEETIIQLHSILGNKWSAIAARLPGRTDNEIKNYWNTHIRKRLLRMGIDPVTHSPRLDLLDLSSVLNSTLCNSSQSNFSRLLGIQHVVNPEILRLATSLLSSQRANQECIRQNHQENQLYNSQVHDQFGVQPVQLQPPSQENVTCTTPSIHCTPFLDDAQLMQANVEQFQTSPTSFSYQNTEPIVWEQNAEGIEDYAPQLDYGYFNQSIVDLLNENQNIDSNDNQNFSVPSVLSTPSSSPITPLNSSSTYFNSSTEDERDSYCSNMLKFYEIPRTFNVNGYM